MCTKSLPPGFIQVEIFGDLVILTSIFCFANLVEEFVVVLHVLKHLDGDDPVERQGKVFWIHLDRGCGMEEAERIEEGGEDGGWE